MWILQHLIYLVMNLRVSKSVSSNTKYQNCRRHFWNHLNKQFFCSTIRKHKYTTKVFYYWDPFHLCNCSWTYWLVHQEFRQDIARFYSWDLILDSCHWDIVSFDLVSFLRSIMIKSVFQKKLISFPKR